MESEKNVFEKSKLSATQILELIGEVDKELKDEELEVLLKDPKVDRVLGCLFGAFIGDALGSFCEFTQKEESTKLLSKTMQMPGGGPFQLEPGQITDDSEMAIHLLTALLTYEPQKTLEDQLPQLLLEIADQYVAWSNSIPFDIGKTCESGLYEINEGLKNKSGELNKDYEKLQNAFNEVSKVNGESLSNGFLMRITPLACLHSLLSRQKNKESLSSFNDLIQGDNKMTHSKIPCFEASTDYVRLISSLILRESHEEISKITKEFESLAEKISKNSLCKTFILQAFQDYKRGGNYMMCATEYEGFFKIAYVYCFQFLREISEKCKNPSDLSSDLYKDIISRTVSQGGDTDTNACIVGGVVGSIIGFQGLPVEYVQKLLGLRLGRKKNNPRSEKEVFYEPRKAFLKMISLIKKFR